MFKTMLHLHLGRIISKESLVIMAKMCCIQKITRTFISFFPKGVQCPRRWLMMSSLETVYPQPGRMSTYSRAIAVKHRIRPGRGLGLPLRQARRVPSARLGRASTPGRSSRAPRASSSPKGPTRPARWTCPPPTRRGGPSARPPPPPWGQRLFPTRRWATFRTWCCAGSCPMTE